MRNATVGQSHRNPYRDCRTVALLTEAECSLHDLTEIDADLEADPTSWAFPEESKAFVLKSIDLINQELKRRELLRHRPGAPAWPTTWPDRRADIDEIKRALPLDQFIEAMFLVQLDRTGRQLSTRCFLPGHDDKSPSFSVDPAKGLWHCFGCQRGGDIISLVQHFLGIEFLDALDLLKKEAGIARGIAEEAGRVG